MDSSGNTYVTGVTDSTDFPTTPGAFQSVCEGNSSCSPPNAFRDEVQPDGVGISLLELPRRQ